MKKFSYLMLLCILMACSTAKLPGISAPEPVSVPGKMYAAFFQQQAAEYRAMCYQAFNFARYKVDEAKRGSKPLAIVTDVDETILDNSPYAVHQTLRGTDHTQPEWEAWTAMAKCDTVPGSYSFLKYAASKGIEIFYITNRTETEKEGTLRNLQLFNFPNADEKHLLLKTSTSKEARRNEVANTHDILLLMGDNLSDFSSLFDKQTPKGRKDNTDQSAALFGHRFIVLPNTTYGDWEGALFQYNYNLTMPQKDSIIRQVLKGY